MILQTKEDVQKCTRTFWKMRKVARGINRAVVELQLGYDCVWNFCVCPERENMLDLQRCLGSRRCCRLMLKGFNAESRRPKRSGCNNEGRLRG